MRSPSDEGGQTLVEMALALPIILMLLIGIVDAAGAVWASGTLAAAAREGTRYAIVHGFESDVPSGPGSASFTPPDSDTAVAAVVRARATGLSGVEVSSQWPDGENGRGSRVTVEATMRYRPILSSTLFGSAFDITLHSGSTLVIHR